MASLFTSQIPSSTDNSDGTPGITTGTTMVFATDGTVTGVRWYCTDTPGGVWTGGLWSVDSSDPGGGTLLASKTFVGTPTGGAWNVVTFDGLGVLDAPVAVTAGEPYRVGMFSGDGRYVYTPLFFASGGLTNGDITAPQNGATISGATIVQGAFRVNPAFSYPDVGSENANCYFVDVLFTSSEVGPAEGTSELVINLDGAVSGARASAGVSALTINFDGAVTGSLPAGGVSALTINLDGAVSGARDSGGVSALTINLDGAVTGARDSLGTVAGHINLDGFVRGPGAGCSALPSFPWACSALPSFSEVQS